MIDPLELAVAEYYAALIEKGAAARAEVKSRVRSERAYHRLVRAKQELRAAELEAQEPIYVQH